MVAAILIEKGALVNYQNKASPLLLSYMHTGVGYKFMNGKKFVSYLATTVVTIYPCCYNYRMHCILCLLFHRKVVILFMKQVSMEI